MMDDKQIHLQFDETEEQPDVDSPSNSEIAPPFEEREQAAEVDSADNRFSGEAGLNERLKRLGITPPEPPVAEPLQTAPPAEPAGASPPPRVPIPNRQTAPPPRTAQNPGYYNASPQLGGLPPRAPQPPVYPTPVPVRQPVYAAPPVKQRRVGTFTLGLSLILLGILIPATLVIGFTAWNWLKFAPLILVFLGLETLIYGFRFKSEKLRYDGLSVFLVILLTFGSLGASFILPPLGNAQEYYTQQSQLESSLESKAMKTMAKLGYQGRAYVSTNDNGWYWLWNENGKIHPWETTLQLRLDSLNTDTPTEEQVAEAFLSLGKELLNADEVYRLAINLDIDTTDGNRTGRAFYSVDLYGDETSYLTADMLARRMNTEYEFESVEEIE